MPNSLDLAMASTPKLDYTTLDISAPQQLNEQPLTNDDILSLQVRAFLEAAEDVDVERETLEELLQVLEDCESGRAAEVSADLDLNVNDDEDESDHDVSADELDISSLYRFQQEGIPLEYLYVASPQLKTRSAILFISS